jgi:hypothetical protein
MLTFLGTCDLCWKKLPYLRHYNRLRGVFITGESITNRNKSTNLRKNSKSFLYIPTYWEQDKLFDEKKKLECSFLKS